MLLDLSISDFVENKTYDFCILGAGPAGITLAKKLADKGKQVLLLEAGGVEYSEQSQALYKCGTTARQAWPETTRLRYLGGTSNHWAGRCRPFEASDFLQNHYGDYPGWPIQYSEIEPYLGEAMEILDISEKGFTARNEALVGGLFSADAYALSPPTRFGSKYLDYLTSNQNIYLYTNANAVELMKDPHATDIKAVGVKTYDGRKQKCIANTYVLAMGAIENARFLLNQVQDNNSGIGNDTGMVGKCFMEHMNIKLGEFILRDQSAHEQASFQFYTTEKFVDSNHIGKANVSFSTLESVVSYGRTAKVKTFFKNLACNLDIADKVQFISSFNCPGAGVIGTMMEQVPGSQSYVKLTDEIDFLGLRRAELHWEIDDLDAKTIRMVSLEVAKEFAESGLGVVKLEDYIVDPTLEIPISPHAHHMGTTRMASDPKYGVVDSNCRVFGIDNLFVAGSSIFSTGGASNPTMPIIQFALRLADHLT